MLPLLVALLLLKFELADEAFWALIILVIIAFPILMFGEAILARTTRFSVPARMLPMLGRAMRRVVVMQRFNHRMSVMPEGESGNTIAEVERNWETRRPILVTSCTDCGHREVEFDDADGTRFVVTLLGLPNNSRVA